MSLLNEKVSTILSTTQLGSSVVPLVPNNTVVSGGVNVVTIQGVCTPTAIGEILVLVDPVTNQPLNSLGLLYESVVYTSEPPLVVTGTPTFQLVAINPTNPNTYNFGIVPDASQINNVYHSVFTDGQMDAVDFVDYSLLGIATQGTGTIVSGKIFVTITSYTL